MIHLLTGQIARQPRYWWLLLALVTLLATPQVSADMFGLFAKKYDVHLCPAVSGRITLNGQPVKGVVVTRDVEYGKPYVDTTQTNADGEFHFEVSTIRSSLPGGVFSQETKVIQTITAEYDGQRYTLWDSPQIGITANHEQTIRLAQLNCELTTEEAVFDFPSAETDVIGHTAASICRWKFGPPPSNF